MGFRDDPIDEEIVDLIKWLNKIPGVSTQASCCGHGKESFYIWLQCTTIDSIKRIRYVFQGSIAGDISIGTHYKIEILPFTFQMDNYLMDMKGNTVLDKNKHPIPCINITVTSDDLNGFSHDIGLASKSDRVIEYSFLTGKAIRASFPDWHYLGE